MEMPGISEPEKKITPAPYFLEEPKELGRPPRLRLWEIEYFFKCPVVGICLTSSEHRHVLKKTGIPFTHRSDFEIHEILVSATEKKCRLSERMDHLLNRKFNLEMDPLLNLDEKGLMAHWEASFQRGAYEGALWAVAARPDLSMKSRREVFGTIHMAMHGNREYLVKLQRQLAFQQERTGEMAQKAKAAVTASKCLRKEYVALQKAHSDLSGRLVCSENEQARLKHGLDEARKAQGKLALEETNEKVKGDLAGLLDGLQEKEMQLDLLRQENRRLSAEMDLQRELSDRFQKEAHELVKTIFAQNRCDATCPSFDLCKKRVLIVGGLTKMESLYRQMIEGGGGIFEYHDGYMKNGLKNLESRLRRADIVLCPTNCNSHAACSLVKNLGKKHNKPVCILASSSLSAMAQALSGSGGVYASGN